MRIAFGAFAALGPDEGVKIFLVVIVEEFLARFDGAFGHDVDAPSPDFYFAIRPAGMIDVARNIGLLPAVDRLSLADGKEISAVGGIFFGPAENAPYIFDD